MAPVKLDVGEGPSPARGTCIKHLHASLDSDQAPTPAETLVEHAVIRQVQHLRQHELQLHRDYRATEQCMIKARSKCHIDCLLQSG